MAITTGIGQTGSAASEISVTNRLRELSGDVMRLQEETSGLRELLVSILMPLDTIDEVAKSPATPRIKPCDMVDSVEAIQAQVLTTLGMIYDIKQRLQL